jgi:hypothetical protein
LGSTDRALSIGVGALLGLVGLQRSVKVGALLALGGAFVVRGLTGHCPLYARLGISTNTCADDARRDECIDSTLDDSFPASDPPAWAGGTS